MADYSIDLAKLGEKESGLTMPESEETEGIDSEDDGPEDFTLNLEKWMRGSEKWRKEEGGNMQEELDQRRGEEPGKDEDRKELEDTSGQAEDQNEPNVDEDQEELGNASVQPEDQNEKDVDEDPEEVGDMNAQPYDQSEELNDEVDNNIVEEVCEESVFEPLGTSTPALQKYHKVVGSDLKATGNHGGLRPPPISRMNTEMQQNRAAEEVFDQIAALQVEVEQLRVGNENNRKINEMLKRAHVADQEEIGRLRDELQTVKEEAVKSQGEAKANEKAMVLERKSREDAGSKFGSLRAKFEPMMQELGVARSTAAAEKKVANDKIVTLEAKFATSQMDLAKERTQSKALQDEIKELSSEIQACKRRVSSQQEAFNAQCLEFQAEVVKQRQDLTATQDIKQAEISSLRSELLAHEHKLSSHQQTSKNREVDHMLEITQLINKVEANRDLESSLDILKMELDHAHKQLRETRLIVETVEQENDRFTERNERQRQENADMAALLSSKTTALEAAVSTVERLNDERTHQQAEKHAGDTEAEAHQLELKLQKQEHQSSINALRTAHEKELKSLKSTLVRAGEGMRKREHRIEKSHREEVASLRQKIASLEKSAAAATKLAKPTEQTAVSPNTATTTELRTAIRAISSKLSAATAALQATRLALTESEDALAASRAEAVEIRAANQEVNRELEARFAAAVEKREKEWRGRVKVLFWEREKMGKALLWAWGKEEMGEQGKEEGEGSEKKQAYRYRYVER